MKSNCYIFKLFYCIISSVSFSSSWLGSWLQTASGESACVDNKVLCDLNVSCLRVSPRWPTVAWRTTTPCSSRLSPSPRPPAARPSPSLSSPPLRRCTSPQSDPAPHPSLPPSQPHCDLKPLGELTSSPLCWHVLVCNVWRRLIKAAWSGLVLLFDYLTLNK